MALTVMNCCKSDSEVQMLVFIYICATFYIGQLNTFKTLLLKTVDPYADVAEADVIAAEPESIRKWREEYAKRIEEKDESARTEQQEWKDKAKEEVEEWYSRQNDQNDKIKKSNREAEEAFVNERDSIVPGHEWEKVANLCDFTSKSYKCTKDTSRMRSIILQLKQSPLKRESKALCASAE
ncbi:expressed hypothetical protein [Trichoplax adhaerens]|uniref:Clathrin light chain n=1 Tax=Trichoplax adhaerens TaxID=10228 RepID=B3RNA5_TRIAD|nr:expressed hypothetical protein [Trichoplax adhaerens]EDV27419.1 expressed hypothetical protein [Trichoplax adhaerens]|eukprot:XP_002109253.1 expressed hypothetical protein [Trichoplax adhaerens]